jgi:hypothetical protein
MSSSRSAPIHAIMTRNALPRAGPFWLIDPDKALGVAIALGSGDKNRRIGYIQGSDFFLSNPAVIEEKAKIR